MTARRWAARWAMAAAAPLALATHAVSGGSHAAGKAKHVTKSGYAYLEPETKRIQDDDFSNPGFFWIDQGKELWRKVVGAAGKSCASCHTVGSVRMKDAATSYPKYARARGKLINLEQRINLCRTQHMKAPKLKYESDALLALTAYVRYQGRGLPVHVRIDGPARPFFEKGKAAYFRRRGLYDLSCHQCHDNKAGRKLRAETVSQGQINGFPAYKLKWQKLGSVHRQFRRCNRLARSVPYPYGSNDYVNLELYVAWRGTGLKVESPSVRP
jgi:sulfur-oxidizing protein SoxA